MIWRLSHRAEPKAVAIADRHYNRQKPGTPQFVPPGRCVVFLSACERALWVTSWPFAEYVKHAWAGAWVNSLFRNEGAGLSSELITQAVSATKALYGDPPALGIVSFIDAGKVKHKRDPGRCYRKAGWKHVGFTKAGLWVYQQKPEDMPVPEAPIGAQASLTLCADRRLFVQDGLYVQSPVHYNSGRLSGVFDCGRMKARQYSVRSPASGVKATRPCGSGEDSSAAN